MSQLDPTGCRKRRRGDRVFKFKSFGEQGCPVEFTGIFRKNVKDLLEFGHLETNLCSTKMHCWSFQLEIHRHPPLYILLFVVEEPIDMSPNRHCKQCQYVGWGHHMICNKKYHFLVPSKGTIVATCLSSSKEGNDPMGVDSGSYGKTRLLVESQGHVMHGVFHSNGFGHLLCINGLETGSELAGHQIIEFWDRLCNGLRVRKVSLNDISQKRGMDLRLIHGVAYGQPWFGRWGFNFGRGTYSVTQKMYEKALEALQGIPLNLIVQTYLSPQNYDNNHQDLPLILSKYQTLSDRSLTTLGELFNFMFELKSRLPNDASNMESYNPGILVETTCRWSPKRVEMATRVIVEALKRARFRWVSRQEVRDAARNYIGDTGLLDFVLKSLGNQVVGNYLVRRSLNPVTKVLEYCLEDVTNGSSNNNDNNNINNLVVINGSRNIRARYKITRLQLMKDMFYVYKYVLMKETRVSSSGLVSAIPLAVRIVLDSKYLVKDYVAGEIPTKSEVAGPEGKFNLYCSVLLRSSHYGNDNTNNSKATLLQPYECVTLKNNATIDELKLEVEKKFQEVYWSLRGLVVESIQNVSLDGSEMVLGSNVIEAGQKLVLEGSSKLGDVDHELYEGENVECVIDCRCGAKDEDGERMVCCDICETWQHSRCLGIPNSQQLPLIFLCARCDQHIYSLIT